MLNPLNLISKFIKSNNQKELDRLKKIVQKINSFEENTKKLKDHEFPEKTKKFKQKLKNNFSIFYSNLDNFNPANYFKEVLTFEKHSINLENTFQKFN